MNELTREECLKALDDSNFLSVVVINQDGDIDYKGEFKETVVFDLFDKLIQEHFDNPPLKFEELKEGMWVWDDKNKAYALVDKWAETGSCLVDIYTMKISKNPSNEIVDTIYKNKFENERFYCREVSQGGQKND